MESDSDDEFINDFMENSAIIATNSAAQLHAIADLASSPSAFFDSGWEFEDATNIGRTSQHYHDRLILKKYENSNPARFKRLFRYACYSLNLSISLETNYFCSTF